MALEIRVSNLLPLISFATRAGSATQADLTAIQADVDALEAQMPLKADKAITITGGGLAIGGGSLVTNQVLTVTKATGAQAEAGSLDTAAVTPLALKTPLDTIRNITITGTTLAAGGGNLTANRVIDVAKASIAETEAGLIDTKAVTPFGMAGLIASMSSAIDALEERVDALQDIIAETLPEALIIVSYGQSLARRRDEAPGRITTVAATDYFMPAGGSEPDDFPTFDGNDAHMSDWVEFAAFVPFVENASSGGTGGEGWGGGLGYQFRRNGNIGPMVFFCPADGSRHWRELRPGTGRWGNLMSYMYNAYEYLRARGELNIRPRFFWTQIEADCDTVAPGGGTSEPVISQAETVTMLNELIKVFNHDMSIAFDKDMSGEPIYITPLNSSAYPDVLLAAPHPARSAASRYAQAGQLEACKANSSKLILLPPHHQFFTYMDSDGVHLGPQGRRYYAELAASISERIESGLPYTAPHVLSATRSGATITANCYFPGGSGGVRDTTTFPDPPTNWPDSKYGVQFWKGTAFVNVSNVTISGSTMTVTLASDPGAGVGELRIAQQPWTSVPTAISSWTPRSNFRDAALSVTAEDATVLYHFMMPQTIAVA
jgi:hypothetical protein